jgi:18S rRNA (guanine1575-N7)-methyltransferase
VNNEFRFDVKKKRPEETYEKVLDYYREDNLTHYASSKSMRKIQQKITSRALELGKFSKNKLILDAGCGPGFASMYLKEMGYRVVALDIISDFLYYYDIQDLNPICADMCLVPFKPNIFDGIISISALQWVFKGFQDHQMKLNLVNLITYFYSILRVNSKAIIQFYPRNNEIMRSIGKLITENTKFVGEYIIDNPQNPKKRKIFLVLEKTTDIQ